MFTSVLVEKMLLILVNEFLSGPISRAVIHILGQCFHHSLCQSAILQNFLGKLNSNKVLTKHTSSVYVKQASQSSNSLFSLLLAAPFPPSSQMIVSEVFQDVFLSLSVFVAK